MLFLYLDRVPISYSGNLSSSCCCCCCFLFVLFVFCFFHPTLLKEGMKGENVLFNDEHNTFYFMVICVGHMVTDHSHNERGNPQPPLLFPISI